MWRCGKMVYSAVDYSKLVGSGNKTMQITEQQRLFLLSLLQDINGMAVFVDRETFDDTTITEASDMLDDLRAKIVGAI
jgi:hypothetical protein